MGFVSAFARRAMEHGVNLVIGFVAGIASTIALDIYKAWAKSQADKHLDAGPLSAVIAAVPPWLLPTFILVAILALAIFAPPILASSSPSLRKTIASRPSELEPDEISGLKQKITTQIDEVYRANTARDEARAERDVCKRELQDVASQRDAATARATGLGRQLANAPSRSDFETMIGERSGLQNENKMLGSENKELKHRLVIAQPALEAQERLKPMLTMRDRLLEMMGGLVLFQAKMDRSDAQARTTSRSVIDEWMDTENLTRAEFDNKFREKLVRLVVDLKQQYGFVHSGLTDEALTLDVYGQSQIEKYLTALQDASSRIDEKILEHVTRKTSFGER